MLGAASAVGICSVAAGILSWSGMTLAQSADADVPDPAMEQPRAESTTSEAGGCVPVCRRGFVCVDSRCISACNPPCGPDEFCSREAECVLRNPPASAASGRPRDRWHDDEELGNDGANGESGSSRSDSTTRHWLHQGFYVRLAFGAGWLTGAGSKQNATYSSKHELSGLLLADEIAIGGSAIPGFVIGGGIYSTSAPAPSDHHTSSMSFEGYDLRGTADVTTGMLATMLIGPFVDFYPNPKKGLHVQGAAGTTLMIWGRGSPGRACSDVTAPDGSRTHSCDSASIPTSDQTGAGWGGMLGVGYEGWASEEWSLGAMLRVLYASNNVYEAFSAFMPSLMFTATYN